MPHWSQLENTPKSSSSRPHNSKSLCFPLKALQWFCFSWKSRVSSLHCVPALRSIVIHLTSKPESSWITASLRPAPPIYFCNQEMGNFLHFVKPSQRASATGLPLQTFLETQRWNEASPLTAGAIRGPIFLIFIKHLYPASEWQFLFIQHLSVGARAGLSMVGGRLSFLYRCCLWCILQIWKE